MHCSPPYCYEVLLILFVNIQILSSRWTALIILKKVKFNPPHRKVGKCVVHVLLTSIHVHGKMQSEVTRQ